MTEEIKSPGNTEAAIESPPESLQAEQAPPMQDAEQPAQGKLPEVPKRKSRAVLVVVVLVLIGLIVVVYIKRDSLLKPGNPSKAELKVLYWQDPMHPAYKSDKPGKAPDCGMDLVPVYAEESTAVKANLPEGAFRITPEKQQLIGVQYGTVSYQTVSRTLLAVGRLTFDETKIVRIHPRVEGWIEHVSVDFIGKLVQKGQPLISIYSPELLQTQQEFLLARRGRDELSQSPFREAVNGAASLYQSARKRLELWDVSEAQIQELEKSGSPTRTVTLNAPTDGFVLTRNAFAKQRVTPETELYTIADISTIWVIADIYEYEAPEIKVGQPATVTLSYFPGRSYRGTVTYINPQLDNETRTLKVRVEIANPGFALKPGMFANVALGIGYGKQVVVPQEAVMDSGAEQLVFVGLDDGYFEARKVQLGAKVDNKFIVLSGLKEGERVVTSANFLVDSESKLKSATGGMGMPGMSHGGGQGGESKAPATNAPATGKPSLPPKQEDHSQHQPKRPE